MKDLTKGNLSETFLRFAIPSVLAGLLVQAYSLIDSIIIGQFLGANGLAAVGATGGFVQLLESFFWGFGTGCGIYIAKLFGGRRYLELRNTVLATLLTQTVASVLIGLLAILFCEPILTMLQVDPVIRADAATYFCICIGGIVFLVTPFFGVYSTNALGISAYPLYMSLLSCVLNIAGNLLSVTVFDWGITGVACSTVISSAAVTVGYLFKFSEIFKKLGAKGKFSLGGYFRHVLPYALPSMYQQGIMYFSSAAVSPLVNRIGAHASASYAVAQKVYNLNASVYQHSTKVMANFTSQCAGSGAYRRILDGVWVAMRQSLLIVLPFLLTCTVFPEAVCSLFFNETATPESVSYSVIFLRVFLPFILFNLINNLFHAILKGLKSTKLLMLSSTIGAAIRVGASFVLAPFYGIYGVYAGWALSWVLEAIFAVIMYFTDKWQTPAMRKALQEE